MFGWKLLTGSDCCAIPQQKNLCVVGDQVHWLPSADEGSIEAVRERRNLFYRQDDIRTKSFAANIDQILVLIAAQPEFSEHQLRPRTDCCRSGGHPPRDCLEQTRPGRAVFTCVAALGPVSRHGLYRAGLCHQTRAGCARSGACRAGVALAGKRTLVLGPSGSGKSTLVNHLVPQAQAQTNAISTALNSGKHTTTTTTLYWLDSAAPAPSSTRPGFRSSGCTHINPMQLAQLMPDLKARHGGLPFFTTAATCMNQGAPCVQPCNPTFMKKWPIAPVK